MRIDCLALPEALAGRVRPLAETTAADLELEGFLSALVICPDDLPDQTDAWFHVVPPTAAGRLPELLLYCHSTAFARPAPASSTLLPPPESWDGWDTPRDSDLVADEAFSPERAAAFLHHHLLLARDLLDGSLQPDLIPASLSEAVQAAWAVGVDGRLARLGLPGFNLAERRGDFSRLFSTAGVLLPDHWQFFQSLWDGGTLRQADILALVRRLPQL